ncbi:MAG: glycoside hydrolase family 99-like domain-containing protein [Acidobacteriota bacterium]
MKQLSAESRTYSPEISEDSIDGASIGEDTEDSALAAFDLDGEILSLRRRLQENRGEIERVAESTTFEAMMSQAVAGSTGTGEPGSDAVSSRVKALAMYLPQFHPIPENDKWWGKGFTEWANVARAKPSFRGHEQPFLPADLGFYDLRLAETRIRQAALAREYGIHGFCYYYYWFHGRKLLEQPLEAMLESGEPDFPFCVCWANENWTRRWDGESQHVLMAQEHSPESDARFIDDVLPALLDPRYIRKNGEPVLLVYRADLLADPRATTDRWREAAIRAGLPGLHLCAVWKVEDPRELGFDAIVEFPPHTFLHHEITPEMDDPVEGFTGRVFDYQEGVAAIEPLPDKGFPVYRGVMPSWDNTPRRRKDATVFARSTPERYGDWLEKVALETLERPGDDDQFLFINAWNEWAEGAVLEPSKVHGRAYLETTRTVLRTLRDPQKRIRRLERRVDERLLKLTAELTQARRYLNQRQGQLESDLAPSFENISETLDWLASQVREQQAGSAWLVEKLAETSGNQDSYRDLAERALDLAERARRAVAEHHRLAIVEHHRAAAERARLAQATRAAAAEHDERDRQRVELVDQLGGIQRLALARQVNPPGRALWLDWNYGGFGLLCKLPLWLLSFRLGSRLRWWRQARQILRSGLFDPAFYLRRYPEVGQLQIDPLYHFVRYGGAEGRDPNPFFNASRYRERHPDAGNPLLHYLAGTSGEVGEFMASDPGRDTTAGLLDGIGEDRMADRLAEFSEDARIADLTTPVTTLEPPPVVADSTPAGEPASQPQEAREPQPIEWTRCSAAERAPGTATPLLFVSHDAARAGAQIYLLEVLESFARYEDYELYLIMRAGGELRADFERYAHVLDVQDFADRSEEAVVAEAVRAIGQSPGVAICNTVASSAVAKQLASMGLSVVSLVHELPTTIEALGAETIHDIVESSQTVIVVSEFVRDAIVEHFEIPADRLTVVYVGVTGWRPENEDRDTARRKIFERYDLPEDATLVLGCGSIHHRKGPDLFVQAARHAIVDHEIDNTYFLWVGGDEQGPLVRSWCEHDIATFGLQDRIRFTGQQDSAVDFYLAADIFLLTSREDPFPLVNLEALARGLPVVAFRDAGGASEALDGEAGIVVPYLDVPEMARALFRLVEAPRYRESIRRRAAARAEDRFLWSRFIGELRDILQTHIET